MAERGALEEEVRTAFAAVQPAWTEARAQAALVGVRAKLGRGRRRAWTASFAVAVVGLGALLLAVPWPRSARIPAPIHLDDGSTVAPLATETVVEPVEMSARRRVVRLRGSARFDVARAEARPFRVELPGLAVEVLGTSFSIEPQTGGRTRVAVAHGRVRVEWRGGARTLAAGEAGLFPPEASVAAALAPASAAEALASASAAEALAPASAAAALASASAAEALASASAAAALASASAAEALASASAAEALASASAAEAGGRGALAPADAPAPVEALAPAEAPVRAAAPRMRLARPWRALAQQGRFHEAYRALGRDRPGPLDGSPDTLMLAADVARYSGHPAEALPPLDRFLAQHGRDPRAPLAAFTQGRILLDELGRPREAAGAFARSRRLDPRGDLAEDALAREVEAWAKAGDAGRAAERAREYQRLHPNGRRANAVRSYGAVE